MPQVHGPSRAVLESDPASDAIWLVYHTSALPNDARGRSNDAGAASPPAAEARAPLCRSSFLRQTDRGGSLVCNWSVDARLGSTCLN